MTTTVLIIVCGIGWILAAVNHYRWMITRDLLRECETAWDKRGDR